MARSDDDRPSGPGFVERMIAAVAPRYALERAIARDRLTLFGYDAANPGSRRGYSGGISKNSSSESPRMNRDRIALMMDARDLTRNMPVLACAGKRAAQYVCSRISYRPRTGDPKVDFAVQTWIEEWMEKYADITGRHDFRQLTELAFEAALRDGDIGGVPQIGEDNIPQIQMVEADRIGDPNKAGYDSMRDDYMHGIWLDPETGRPIEYEVYSRSKNATYTLDQKVAANRFYHLFFPSATDQYRGVTWYACVLAQARDLYEMFAFERGAAKWASSIAGFARSIDARSGIQGADSAAAWDGQTKNDDGQPAFKVQPNAIYRLKPNEDVTFAPGSTRPSGAFLAYVEASLRDIAMGLNVPYGFFDMREFNGVTSRLETQQCQRTFQKFQRVLLQKWLNPCRDLALAAGIVLGKIPAHPRWNWGRWQFGPHITADVGYQTQSDLQLMLNGLKTGTEIAEEAGEDFEEMSRRLAEEAEQLYALAIEKGIPLELLAPERFPNATQLLSAVNAAGDPQPPPPPTLDVIGDKGASTLADMQLQVAQGQIPREQVVQTLVKVWNMDPKIAEAITPEFGSAFEQPALMNGANRNRAASMPQRNRVAPKARQKQEVRVRVNGSGGN